MSILWKQLIYGKQVQSIDGPIVTGKDHECTGQTKGIPFSLQQQMTPSVVGPGTSDLTKWNDYVWNDLGGLAIQPVVIDGEAWVVAGRVRGRSERGENKQGRYYTQTHYVTVPAKDYSPLSVLGLHENLRAIPMVKKNMDMPELAIPLRDRPLEGEWLDMIAPLLRITLSGLPFSVWAPKLQLQELVDLFHLVHCALPKALAWKMSIRIGSYEMNEGDVVLNSGQDIFGGPRMIGFRFDDFARNEKKINDIQKAEKHLIDDQKLLGDRYIDYLSNHMRSCQTLSALQEKIAEHFPYLTKWDYFPLDMSFTKAGVQFIRTIFEKDGLEKIEQALRGQGAYPSLSFFYVYRGKVLELVADQCFGNADAFVAQTVAKWSDVWKEVRVKNSQIQSLYPLFFDDKPWSEQTAALLKQNIPETFQTLIRGTISKELGRLRASSESYSCWVYIMESFSQIPPWIQQEIQQHDMFLLWSALEYERNGDGRLLELLKKNPLYLWYSYLLQGQIGKEYSLSKWFSACPTDSAGLSIQESFVEEVFKNDPITGLQLLSHASPSLPIHSRFDFPNVFTMSGGADIALAFLTTLKDTEQAPSELMRIALVFRKSLSQAHQDRLYRHIQSDVSPWLGLVLFGQTTSKSGTYDEDARQVFIHEYKKGIQESSSIVETLYALEDPAQKEVANKEMASFFQKRIIPAQCTYSKIADILMEEKTPSESQKVSIQGVQINVLTWFLSHWNLPAETKHIQNLGILFAVMRSREREYSLCAQQLTKILSHPDWLKNFAKLAEKRAWESQESWRIIARWAQKPTALISEWSAIEEEVLRALPEKQKLICLSSGMIVDGEWNKLHKEDYQEIDNTALGFALWGTLYSKDELLQKLLLTESLRRLYKEDQNRFIELKREYTAEKNIFSSLWSSVEQFSKQISRSFSEGFPEDLTLDKAVSTVLEGYDAKSSQAIFSSPIHKK